MIKRLIKNLKNDYKSVSERIHYNIKFKVPELIILIYYIIMLPVGLILYPLIKIWTKVLLWKLTRSIEKIK